MPQIWVLLVESVAQCKNEPKVCVHPQEMIMPGPRNAGGKTTQNVRSTLTSVRGAGKVECTRTPIRVCTCEVAIRRAVGLHAQLLSKDTPLIIEHETPYLLHQSVFHMFRVHK